MRSRVLLARMVLAVLILGLQGCYAREISISPVLALENCGIKPGAAWLDMQKLARLRGAEMVGSTQTDQDIQPLMFSVSNGRQPTPGYAFEYASARLDNDTLIVELNWLTPDPELTQAQVITSPCTVISINAKTPPARVQVWLADKFFAELPIDATTTVMPMPHPPDH